MSFVFNDSLSSFPRFLYFLAILRFPDRGPPRNPSASPGTTLPSGACFTEGRTFWVQFAQNTLKIEFVFSSFSMCLSLFSMTYWLRSYNFALFRSPRLPGSVVKFRGREIERSRSRGVADGHPADGPRVGVAVSSRFSIPGLLNSSTP